MLDNICDSGVYSITNKCNGKIYVGSSVKIKQRWRGHISDLNKNKHRNPHLQRSWNKYGSDNFSFNIIENCSPKKVLELEQAYIDKLNCLDSKYGYNINPKAQNSLGVLLPFRMLLVLHLHHLSVFFQEV